MIFKFHQIYKDEMGNQRLRPYFYPTDSKESIENSQRFYDKADIQTAARAFYKIYYPYLTEKKHHMKKVGSYRVYELRWLHRHFLENGLTGKEFIYSMEDI